MTVMKSSLSSSSSSSSWMFMCMLMWMWMILIMAVSIDVSNGERISFPAFVIHTTSTDDYIKWRSRSGGIGRNNDDGITDYLCFVLLPRGGGGSDDDNDVADEDNDNDDNSSSNGSNYTFNIPNTIPSRKYGYRTVPFSWEELQDIILIENNLAKLSRSIPEEVNYQTYLKEDKVLRSFQSIYDYILHTKFDLDKYYNETSKRWYVDKNEKNNNNNDSARTTYTSIDEEVEDHRPQQTKVVLVRNDFPYYVEDNVEHWILWKLHGGTITEEDVIQAKEELRIKFAKEQEEDGNGNYCILLDTIHWENPSHLQSLPDIHHVHILALLRDCCRSK